MATRVPLSGVAASGGLKDLLSPSIQKSGGVQEDIQKNGHKEEAVRSEVKLETSSQNAQEMPSKQRVSKAEGNALDVAQLKALGNASFARKDFHTAVAYYTQALELDSENAVLYANRAQALLNLGRYVSALDDANRAVSLNLAWWKAHAKRAQACTALKLFGSAVAASEEALRLQPDDAGLNKCMTEAKARLRTWKAKTDQRGIAYPGWEETRADIWTSIDVDKQVNISLTLPVGKTVSRKTGLNYLHQAVIGGDLPLVVDLTRLGAGVNIKTSTRYPCTPLFLALTAKARADANPLTPVELARAIPGLKGQALSEALEAHYFSTGRGEEALPAIAEYLLSLGADTEERSADDDPLFPGMTPLAAAAEQQDWAACELLLQFGADPKAAASGGSSRGRTVEQLVSGESPDRTPESKARMEELMSSLDVVDYHPGTNGKAGRIERVSQADMDRENRVKIFRFRALVERFAGEPRPPVLCRCGSRTPVLECHGRGLEGLDTGTVLRRLSPGAPCPCQKAAVTYEECCWKSQNWVLDDDSGGLLNIVRSEA